MKVIIDIPDNEIPTKQDIISVELHCMDGKICACKYPFIEMKDFKINVSKHLILDLKDDKVSPISVASALIDYAVDNCHGIDKDIEFIRQLSGHLEIAWQSCERNRYNPHVKTFKMEED